MPTLHGIDISPFVRKVRIVLAEKEIAYENDPVIHFALPDGYEKLHPLRKIPVWTTEEGENIPDSSVIAAYLDRVHPEPRLIPEDPVLFARAAFLEEYSDTALAVSVAKIFLEKFATPRFFNRPSDERKMQAALDELQPIFAYLNDVVGGRDYMVGDSFTIADAAIASALIAFRHTGNEIDAAAYPDFRRYADRILTRPTIAAIYEGEVSAYMQELADGGGPS